MGRQKTIWRYAVCPKRFSEARKNNTERNKWVKESSVGLFSSPRHLGCGWKNPYRAAPGGSVIWGITMFPSDRAQESFLEGHSGGKEGREESPS